MKGCSDRVMQALWGSQGGPIKVAVYVALVDLLCLLNVGLYTPLFDAYHQDHIGLYFVISLFFASSCLVVVKLVSPTWLKSSWVWVCVILCVLATQQELIIRIQKELATPTQMFSETYIRPRNFYNNCQVVLHMVAVFTSITDISFDSDIYRVYLLILSSLYIPVRLAVAHYEEHLKAAILMEAFALVVLSASIGLVVGQRQSDLKVTKPTSPWTAMNSELNDDSRKEGLQDNQQSSPFIGTTSRLRGQLQDEKSLNQDQQQMAADAKSFNGVKLKTAVNSPKGNQAEPFNVNQITVHVPPSVELLAKDTPETHPRKLGLQQTTTAGKDFLAQQNAGPQTGGLFISLQDEAHEIHSLMNQPPSVMTTRFPGTYTSLYPTATNEDLAHRGGSPHAQLDFECLLEFTSYSKVASMFRTLVSNKQVREVYEAIKMKMEQGKEVLILKDDPKSLSRAKQSYQSIDAEAYDRQPNSQADLAKFKFLNFDKANNKVILQSHHKSLNELLEDLQLELSKKGRSLLKDSFVTQGYIPLKKSKTDDAISAMNVSVLDEDHDPEIEPNGPIPGDRKIPRSGNFKELMTKKFMMTMGKESDDEFHKMSSRQTKKPRNDRSFIMKRASQLITQEDAVIEIVARIEVKHEIGANILPDRRISSRTLDKPKSSPTSGSKTVTYQIDVTIIPHFPDSMKGASPAMRSHVLGLPPPGEGFISFWFKKSKKMQTTRAQSQHFLNLVSHEMRAPLIAIDGLLRLFMSKAPQQLKGIDQGAFQTLCQAYIGKATVHIQNLLDACQLIHEMSKTPSEQKEMKTTQFSLEKLLEETCKFFEKTIQDQKKPIKIRYEWDDHIDAFIKSDPVRIRQILINLISNAVKYTTKGQIVVSAHAETFHKLKISVKDSGLGIKTEDLGRLFGEFARVQNKEDEMLNEKGVGLGLMLSNQLARTMGPADQAQGITVTSVYGQGSEFSLYIENKFKNQIESLIFKTKPENMKELRASLSKISMAAVRHETTVTKGLQMHSPKLGPFEKGNADPLSSLPDLIRKGLALKLEKIGMMKNFTVLVVDDSELILYVLQAILENLGMRCVTATNPIDALEIMKKRMNSIKNCSTCRRFDMVFTDMEMPFMTGVEFAMEIRTIPEYDEIPIICSSAGEIDPDKSKFFTASLMKPIESTEVETLVEGYLAKKVPHTCSTSTPRALNSAGSPPSCKNSRVYGPVTKLTQMEKVTLDDVGINSGGAIYDSPQIQAPTATEQEQPKKDPKKKAATSKGNNPFAQLLGQLKGL